jgi:hypothetical protein
MQLVTSRQAHAAALTIPSLSPSHFAVTHSRTHARTPRLTHHQPVNHPPTHYCRQACPEEEIECEAPFRFEPDAGADGNPRDLTPDQVKALILEEIAAYHPSVPKPPESGGAAT